MMRFRLGMLVGGAIGYVLGARAGRQRYEQIKRMASRARAHPATLQLIDQATGVSDLARSGLAGSLRVGSERLRDAADDTVVVRAAMPDSTAG